MDNIKALIEKRNSLVGEMKTIVKSAKDETRALSTEENGRLDEIKAEIDAIDETVRRDDESRSYEAREVGGSTPSEEEETRALDEKFLRFIRGEERALDVGQNGGIIPNHIANKIIETVKELSPILQKVTIYNVGGNLLFPVYEEGIAAKYVDDMEELTETGGKFSTVKLENFIVGVLSKVSKSLVNRTDIDVLPFIIKKVAEGLRDFLEKELVAGSEDKMQGVITSQNIVTAASATAITGDELIDLQMEVPEAFQRESIWLMHKSTLKKIRKLKDNDGNYLLNRDITNAFGWSILGKPVYFTESMPEIAAEAKAVVYGDLSGMYLKFAKNIELQVLIEKYATQHAVGIVGYVECDSDIVEPQKLAILQMAA